MKLTWLGHSGFRIETGGSVLILDPYLIASPKFNEVFKSKAKGRAAALTRGATHVALTHGHDDHIGESGAICVTNQSTLIAVFELAKHLEDRALADFGTTIKVERANTGGTIYCEDFDVTFVPALHSTSTAGIYFGDPCGLVIKCKKERHTVYHMGDTAIFGDMALIDRIHKPDIGIVPIGDRYTMNPETAALACREYFNFKAVFPCHYGTFPDELVPDTSGFREAMADKRSIVKDLEIGGSLKL